MSAPCNKTHDMIPRDVNAFEHLDGTRCHRTNDGWIRDQDEPTEAQQRCMIYRRTPRTVANACLECGLSIVACHSWAEHESRRCCPDCTHGDSA